jgi:hypothetical protein
MSSIEYTPLPRCCPRHPDYDTLAKHLASEFSDVPPDRLHEQLVQARAAVQLVRLPDTDELEMAEIICRYQLSYAAGRLEEAARLDPQTHLRRRAQPVDSTVSVA